MPTRDELKVLQALPLNLKVKKTLQRIREWVDYWGEDGVYVSFSGGKDSTVLLYLVRSLYPDVPAVFCDTGLEYPEIREFVKTFDNVVWLKPSMNFKEVINKYGYPFISKEVSDTVYSARRWLRSNGNQGCKSLTERLLGLGAYEVKHKNGKIARGYRETVLNAGKYRELEPDNGWGSVETVRDCLRSVLDAIEGIAQYGELPLEIVYFAW